MNDAKDPAKIAKKAHRSQKLARVLRDNLAKRKRGPKSAEGEAAEQVLLRRADKLSPRIGYGDVAGNKNGKDRRD